MAIVVEQLTNIFHQFKPGASILNFEVLKTGHINHTYVVELADEKFILQSINKQVFPSPLLVMNNLNEVMTSFLESRVDAFIAPLLTIKKTIFHQDSNEDYWRVFPFVPHVAIPIQPNALENSGYVFGEFIHHLSIINALKIKPTIPHFHQLDFYFEQLKNVIQLDVKNRVATCQEEIDFLLSHQNFIRVFQNLSIPKRLTHNDAKLDNLLFLNESMSKWKVIDYDTIMMGYTIFDYGDLVRSTFSLINKDITSYQEVKVDSQLIQSLKSGFIAGAKTILTKAEIKLLDDGVLMILYEQAIRFLSDYLSGDIYYRIDFSEENLVRARKHVWLLRYLDS